MTGEDWGHDDWTSVNSTSWSYDWVGNRGTGTDYNQADEYLKDNGYKYDYLGNTEYDPDNSSTPRTRYYYNSDNLLSQVDDVTGGGTTSTTMTWDADQQRLRLARGSDTWEMVYDPTASVPAVLLAKNYASSSTTYMYNVREPDGWLLCSFDAAETPNKYYCHFDGLGSTVLVTNGSGSISDSFTYGAWGDVLNFPANNQKPYRYVGRLGYYAHTSTQGTALADLMQLGVRFYDDGIGRFTQRNPLLMASSLYLYVGARSTSAVDPSGYKYEAIYGDGRICVDSSCSGQSYFPGGIQNAPNYGGPSQRLPNPPCPSKGKTRQNCALTDGIVVPPGTSFDVDGFPQRSKTPPTNFLKIAGGWTCTFTCNSAATGNNIKLSCKITSKIPGPGLSPPKWENNPNF